MPEARPDRLDRIEARVEESDRRFEKQFDREMQLLADLRTRQEVQSQNIEQLRQAVEALREHDEIQSQNLIVQS